MSEFAFDKPALLENLDNFGIDVSDDRLERLDVFAKLLCEWNQKMNLTGITDPTGIAVLHFADSLTLLSALDIKNGAKLIDVGTGAGFPAVPTAIMRPDLDITLLDSLNKRLTFLNSVCDRLSLSCKMLHARAEEAARRDEYRDRFDVAVARAVAPLSVLCEYCLPFVKKGGIFAAMKGPSADEELKTAKNAISKLSGRLCDVKEFTLSDGSKRKIIIIEKIACTDKKYPRQSGKISKSPL